MSTPPVVLNALAVTRLPVGKFHCPPITLRKFLALEHAGNAFVRGDITANDAEVMLHKVSAALTILCGAEVPPAAVIRATAPEDFGSLIDDIAAVIAQGWSTVLPMKPAPVPGEAATPAPRLVDHIGLVPRLLANAMARLHLSYDEALDMPLAALFVVTAGYEAIDGKVPVTEGYIK